MNRHDEDGGYDQRAAAGQDGGGHPLSPSQRLELAQARRTASWIGLIVPLALTAAGTVITAVWIPRLPDPVATRWGASLEPSGFGPPWTNAVLALGVGLLLAALSLLRGAPSRRRTPVWSSMNRFLPALVLASAVLVQALAVGTALVQLDAADAREAGSVGPVLALAFGFALLAGVAGFLMQPRLRIAGPDDARAVPLQLGPRERAVWLSETRLGDPLLSLATVLAALPLIVLVVALAVGSPVWWAVPLPFLVFTLAWAVASRYRVRIDDDGVEARAVLGWPVFRVAASDIVSVRAAEITPLAEFGGWGIRWAPGRFGVVMRTGPGIVVTRGDGRTWTVTVDRPERGAALLAAVAERARGAAG